MEKEIGELNVKDGVDWRHSNSQKCFGETFPKAGIVFSSKRVFGSSKEASGILVASLSRHLRGSVYARRFFPVAVPSVCFRMAGSFTDLSPFDS